MKDVVIEIIEEYLNMLFVDRLVYTLSTYVTSVRVYHCTYDWALPASITI